METVLHQLQTFHKFIAPVDVAPRKKTIRFHFLESLPKPAVHDHDDPSEDETPKTKLSLGQAVANLRGEGSAFKPSRSSLWKDIASLEKLARSDTSLYAFKTACAVIVYTVFILAPSLQKFFTTYGLTSGILTIVVAMSPTLGNSILVFAIQIASTSFGTIFGMAVLYIFKHVGGFYFNPYGIVCLLSLYAIPLCWIIYIKPIYWAGGFLAMNASSVLVITEWVYREVPGSIRPTFDSPALRAGKALVAMSIALGIAAVFQIFILRSPARRALRAQLAGVAASLASYNVLLGVLIEAGVPSNPEDKPSSDVESMTVISKALISREAKIQMDLLGLLPLLKFAAAEPTFGQPFEGEALVRVIRSQQLVLDRLRQARMAMGGDGFSTELRELFINELSPYRGQVKRFARSLFFFVSTSLATKTPLPSELPSMGAVSKAIQHDAFVLSRRIARSEHGQAVIGSQGFVRVWFYLISMASVLYHLENTEPDLRILFGHADDNSHLFSE
ncbi:hypothetical protein MNV49_006505 [Pseudohyphozyma bogoriensis]|nr:hypothetical protein MNV49_006505 [Pseudohyphozyma bogoriensis]